MDLSDRCSISDNSEFSCSGVSDSESANNSTPEDERIKQLFMTCDTDEDGYITSQDIYKVCSRLNLEYCVEEIMEQLGSDANGRISFPEFVQRRMQLLNINPSDDDTSTFTSSEAKDPLIEADSVSSFESCSNPSLSINEERAFSHENSDNNCSTSGDSNKRTFHAVMENHRHCHEESPSVKHESSCWEFDSGAHDLENEIIPLHRLIEITGNALPTNINDLIDLLNEHHIAIVSALKQEINDVKSQIQILLKERDFLEHKIISAKDEKNEMIRDFEKRLSKEHKKYEERITEFHTIIAEMSQKLDASQYMTIIEEEDEHHEHLNEEFEIYFNNRSARTLKENVSGESEESLCEYTINEKAMISEREINYPKESNNAQIEEDFKEKEMMHHQCSFTESNGSFANDDTPLVINTKTFEKKAIYLEIERLKCRVSHLESQNYHLLLQIEKSAYNTENLTVLLEKYKSNINSLTLEVKYSDRSLDISELLIALLESEIALILANCRAAGLGKLANQTVEEESRELALIIEQTTEKRKAAEDAALAYLLKHCEDYSCAIGGKIEFCRDDECKLRRFLEKCKFEKSLVRESIDDIETLEMEIKSNQCPYFDPKPNMREHESQLQMDSVKSENPHFTQLHNDIIRDKNLHLKNLSDVSKNQDNSYIISNNNLQMENIKLNENIEKYRKKYYIKKKKLENKISQLTQFYNSQIKSQQRKIFRLEKDLNCVTEIAL